MKYRTLAALLICLIETAVAKLPAAADPATDLPLIGSIRVATGTLRTLHGSALPTSIIVREQAQSVATGDALVRQLPGVDRSASNSAFSNYGLNRVSFDGAGNDRGYILVDGIPAQDAFGGQVNWLAYPAADIERAELLRGPGGALYGSGAIGGTLAISTFGPDDRDANVSGSLGTSASRNADLRYRKDFGHGLAAAIATNTRTESYSDLGPGYTTPIDQPAISQSQATHIGLRYHHGASSMVAHALLSTDGQQEGRPNYAFNRSAGQYDVAYVHASTLSSLQLTSYDRTTNIVNTADQSPSNPGALQYTQSIPTHENGLLARYTVGGKEQLQLRSDYRGVSGESRQTGPLGALQSDTSGRQASLGFAAQETLATRRAEYVLGVRTDRITTSNGTPAAAAISPRVAARYTVSKALAARASFGTGIRAPYLNELLRSYKIGAITYKNSTNLAPERSTGATLGLDALTRTMHFSVDATAVIVAQALGFTTISPTVQQRANTGQTRTDGIIASDTWKISRRVQATASYTTQNARVVVGRSATLGKRLPYVPNRIARVGLATESGVVHVDANLALVGKTFADDLNRMPLDPAAILDLGITAPIADGAVLTIAGEDIGGAHYLSSPDRYGLPATLRIGVSVTL